MTGLFGGAFDPPHNGHVALARAALERLPLERLLVLVNTAPGHKEVVTPADARFRLAALAFGGLPRTSVERDPHPFTVDLLRARPFQDPILVIGADEWKAFATWKEPEEVLRRTRVAVAARDGHASLEGADGERVRVLPFDSPPVSSRDIRARAARGEPIDGLVPPPVADLISRLGLYREA